MHSSSKYLTQLKIDTSTLATKTVKTVEYELKSPIPYWRSLEQLFMDLYILD